MPSTARFWLLWLASSRTFWNLLSLLSKAQVLKSITWRVVWTLMFYRFYVWSLNPFPLRFCNYSSPHQQLLPFNMAFLHSWPERKVQYHSYVPCSMARSLVTGRFSLIRIRLVGECLSSCTRATSSFSTRFLFRNTKCIEFSASTSKEELTLTSITRCNSVLSLCANFRCRGRSTGGGDWGDRPF